MNSNQWIWHGFTLGNRPVQVLGGEAAFAGRGKFPLHLSACGVNGVKIAVVTPEIDHAIVHGWGGDYSRGGLELPLLRPGLQVHRVEIAIGAANVGGAICHCRRRIM